jgi:asparagine synthetase B (glutamine-hydrolysing)
MLLEAPTRPSSLVSAEWIVWCGSNRGPMPWAPSGFEAGSDDFVLRSRLGTPDRRPVVSLASSGGVHVLVDGFLNDPPPEPLATPASWLLGAYTTGQDYLHLTRGVNVRIVVDTGRRELVAARDPLGVQPLFYARYEGGIALSPTVESLLALPGLSHELSREALADHLCGRWPDAGETYYRSIRRVPQAHALRWSPRGSLRVERYWDPYPAHGRVQWLRRDEIELFDRAFERAVSRSLLSDATGIFLSGGLDSVSVAAVATDLRRRSGAPPLVALSLGFPDDCDEEAIQRGVAAQLGLPSVFLPFAEAVGTRPLIDQALELTAGMPMPMLLTWSPAYSALTRRARERGIEAILTGGGGDEWLSITPIVAADYLKAGDAVGLARFLAMWWRSYPFTLPGLVRSGLWRFGLRPLAGMWLGRAAPGWWQRRRGERLVASTPDWVAPDPTLRAAIDTRAIASMPPFDPPEGFYFSDIRRGISHPLVSMEFEESEVFSRRHGVRKVRPFFDLDLVELLFRTPPELLAIGGRAKGLVRDSVARRFPDLGFERQKKRAATTFFRTTLREQLPRLWRRDGGARTLIELGVVDETAIGRLQEGAFAGTLDERLYRAWSVFNLEHWVRPRV